MDGVVELDSSPDFLPNWAPRQNIVFENLDVTENLVDFPVLVKLDSMRIDYSKVEDVGEDLRFTDSNGSEVLFYEIQEWNESGESFMWVKVPQIDANSDEDFIYVLRERLC